MPSLLSFLSGASKIAGAGYAGYGQDKQQELAETLARLKAARDAENDRIANALKVREINTPRLGDANYADALAGVEGAKAKATLQPDIDKAKGIAEATAPIDINKAVTIAQHEVPIKAAEAENAAAATERHAPPIAVANKDGSQTLVSRRDALGQQKAATGGGGMGAVRGLGPGGVFGAGSGLGSVKEMEAANPNLKKFEQGFLGNMPTSDLDALDRFRQKLASGLHQDGFLSAAKAAEAERELVSSNPDLVNYARNLKQWIVSDMNLSRGGTDERARTDEMVSGLSVPLSSMPAPQRAEYLNQIWEARDARLAGLQQSAAAAKAILDRVSGAAGVGASHGAAKPTLGERIQQLKQQGVSKEQARATLMAEGYSLAPPE